MNDNLTTNASNEAESPAFLVGAVMRSSLKIGDIIKDDKGNLYKILNFTNSLFMMLEDLNTNEFVISSGDYYYA